MTKLITLGVCLALSGVTIAQTLNTSRIGKVQREKHNFGVKYADKTLQGEELLTREISPIEIGASGNPWSVVGGHRSNLSANPALNTIVFVHRQDENLTDDPDDTHGWYTYDISKDGGKTWESNQGPLYVSNNKEIAGGVGEIDDLFANARYPMGAIYNPSGNTDVDAAYITYMGPNLVATNGDSWGGLVNGAQILSQADSATRAVRLSVDSTQTYFGIPDKYVVTPNGKAFVIEANSTIETTSSTYMEEINIHKGTWVDSLGRFDFDLEKFPLEVAKNADNASLIGSMTIEFSLDGNTGYMAFTGKRNVPNHDENKYYLFMYKTTDGGETWGDVVDIDLDAMQSIKDAFAAFAEVNELTDLSITPMFEIDITVDKDGNPHLLVPTSLWVSDGTAQTDYTVNTAYGGFGMFDIYSEDGGSTFNAMLLDYPETFRGTFGSGENQALEDHRSGISRNEAGDKIFFTWFDTNIEYFGDQDGNFYPDARGVSIDLVAKKRTGPKNFTRDTDADGLVLFGNIADHAVKNGDVHSVPVVYSTVEDPIGAAFVTTPVQYNYIGLEYAQDDYEFDFDHDFWALNVEEIQKEYGIVTNIYPNPTNSIATVEFDLVKATQINVEVLNALGQVVNTELYNLNAGKNVKLIDASNFEAGLYSVKYSFPNGNVLTQRLIVN